MSRYQMSNTKQCPHRRAAHLKGDLDCWLTGGSPSLLRDLTGPFAILIVCAGAV